MLVKVIGGGKGRGACGHIIRKDEPYYIINESDKLTATCADCIKRLFGSHPQVDKIIEAEDLVNWPKY